MKLFFSSVLAFFFIISTVVYADKPIAGEQHKKAGEIEACLEGIADTNGAVAGIANDLSELIHTDIKNAKKIKEIQHKLFRDGQLALSKYGTFNPECKDITEKYTYDQDTILLKGIKPLLTSVTSLYKLLMNRKDKVDQLQLGDLLSGFLKAVTHAVDEFKTWSDKYGSDRVHKVTSGPIDDIILLVDEVNETYGFQ